MKTLEDGEVKLISFLLKVLVGKEAKTTLRIMNAWENIVFVRFLFKFGSITTYHNAKF